MSDLDVLDLDDLKPTALKRMLKQALLKGHKSDEKKKVSAEDSDKEQEDLANLHGEKGDSKAPPVKGDDLPDVLKKVAKHEECEDEDCDEDPTDERPFPKKKKSPLKKKRPFPFKKKG